MLPVYPSPVKRLIASLQVGASRRVYVCPHSPYAALNRAGLLEWEMGFPMSENFAIADAKLQIIPFAWLPQVKSEDRSVYEQLGKEGSRLGDDVLQRASH